MSSKFITEIKQDASTEDYYIEIPDHILNTLKWEEGDEICWSIKEGKIILTKIKDGSSTEEEYRDFDECYDENIQKEYYINPEATGAWQTPYWP